MIGERRAIVDDELGITRDRLYGTCEWLGHKFSLIDTGGIEIKNRPFQEQIRMQAEIAINEADVIVFVVDGKLGITTDDRVVTGILRKVNKFKEEDGILYAIYGTPAESLCGLQVEQFRKMYGIVNERQNSNHPLGVIGEINLLISSSIPPISALAIRY